MPHTRPDPSTSSIEETQLTPGIIIREGEVIYDMCWYPGMTTLDPATCCVLSSSRDHPVHLWDAFTGEVRISEEILADEKPGPFLLICGSRYYTTISFDAHIP